MIYITGDTHGDFTRVAKFCEKFQTSKEDILIILGDVGLNYYKNKRDVKNKEFVSSLPITLFCIYGNHEARPLSTKCNYLEKEFCNGIVWYEEEYPNILFAKDGEYYDFNLDGILYRSIVIGGAYSVDKFYRLARGFSWFEDEQPNQEIKDYVEEQLEKESFEVDIVLSHTCPLKYEPVEWFLTGLDQSSVDKSTEEWLDKIEDSLKYKKWYCGHYHGSKKIDKLQFMFTDFDVLSIE